MRVGERERREKRRKEGMNERRKGERPWEARRENCYILRISRVNEIA